MKAALALLTFALPVHAADLTMPYPATQTFTEVRPLSSQRIATGRFAGILPTVTVEGALTRRIWQLAGANTTLQILAPLRDQLITEGWTEVFECATRSCGGFDFRFEIDVTPAPQMFVDLADFRYLALNRDEAWTTLLVSLSGGKGYVQMTEVDPDAVVEAVKSTSNSVPSPLLTANSNVMETLIETGHAILADLDFSTGTTQLAQDSYPSLEALAEFLEANSKIEVALVGHTDAEGGAQENMVISHRRAEAARDLLIERYGIAANRVEAHGVGYFAPITRNDTDAGRMANRRVEVVVISID